MKNKLKVMLVDDHKLVRKGIKALIEKENKLISITEADSAENALELLSISLPNIIITDLSMPGMSGINLITEVKKIYPEIGVLVLSMHNDKDYIMDALDAGAMGYLTKDAPPEEIIEAINNLSIGKMYYSSSLTDILARQIIRTNKGEELVKSIKITIREIEVLQLIIKGLSNKDIADELVLSKRTIDNHRSNLMKKMGAKNTADIVRLAYVNNLVPFSGKQ
jgi:DNA-binding NarL/FixJ family response regulator